MRKLTIMVLGILAFVILMTADASAQKLDKKIYIQAQAMGTSTQLGRTANITIIVNELSTEEERQGLIEAFQQKQNQGLVSALEKMKSKGRLSITGTLGYDVAYVKKFPQSDGSTIVRIVTNRPLRFGEVWSDSRSSDYNLSAIELHIYPDKKKNTGTLAPAAELKMNKSNQLELELFQNPWKLVNIQFR